MSIFAVIASWKDFLWPLLVLRNPDLQPLSVRLPSIEATTDKGVLMAALAISTLIPIVLFLVFQRMFLRGAGLGGAVKAEVSDRSSGQSHGPVGPLAARVSAPGAMIVRWPPTLPCAPRCPRPT